MSADRLAQIEAALRTDNPMRWERVPNEDVLALVEIAKAARDTGWRDADGLCWCPESVEMSGQKHIPRCERLREALVRLDSQGDP